MEGERFCKKEGRKKEKSLQFKILNKSVLPQLNRLKKNKDINHVLKKGKRLKEGFLILKKIPNQLEQVRFVFIVSQKFSKNATLRNKIKRRLRELVGLRLKKIKKGIDIALIAVPGLENKDFWGVEETINKLFQKAGIINNQTNSKRN